MADVSVIHAVFVCFVAAAATTSSTVFGFPEQGRWRFQLDQNRMLAGVVKAVYEETSVYIRVLCDSDKKDARVSISYALRLMRCYQETIDPDDQDLLSKLHDHPDLFSSFPGETSYFVTYLKSAPQNHTCDHSIVLKPEEASFNIRVLTSAITEQSGFVGNDTASMSSRRPKHKDRVNALPLTSSVLEKGSTSGDVLGSRPRREVETAQSSTSTSTSTQATTTQVHNYGSQPQVVVHDEGIFVVTVKLEPMNADENFTASVELEIRGARGYLSAVDWPLLPFYGSMSVVYFIYGLAWLIVLGLQWRDLLRIQFWIGGVIFLGMVEKAVFYAEYQSVNSTGNSVRGAVLFAELVSCVKRTLARMLVIIVSLGFGIVKPRLGAMLHRVVSIGALYGLLCSLEAYLRVMRPRKEDPARTMVLAEVPLAIVDTAICWWIFSNLVQTTRTLRLRRNIVKLSLYRHFTNALIFACIASVAFMVWVYKAHNLPNCVADWKELWVDDAYWHLLFSVILLVIMFLWRPTNNNQRYAFMPLIDAADEEDDMVTNDAFDGMKMRSFMKGPPIPIDREAAKRAKAEDDLCWVEENIPSSLADSALPLLDSDEEIMNTKFEMSKME